MSTTVSDIGFKRRRFREEDRPLVALGLFGSAALLVVVPTALMILWGVADRWSYPNLLPDGYTLEHWRSVTAATGIVGALLTSLIIAGLVTLFTALVAFPTAWAMARFPFRLKRAMEVFILAPLIIPGLVVAVGIGKMFLAYGLAYSLAGVVLVQMVGTLPMMIRLLTATLETIPEDLIDAARSLGASGPTLFVNLILPLSLPGLLAGGLLTFIGSFEEFDKTFIVGAPVIQTLPVKLYFYLDPQALQFPYASIVAFILLVPSVLIFLLAGRIMRDDIMAAGMGKI